MNFNLYGNISLCSFFLALGGYLYVTLKKEMSCRKQVQLLMLVAAYWCFTSVMESLSPSLEMKIFWSVASYAGSQSAPVIFFIFAMYFTQNRAYLSNTKIALLFVLPVIFIIMAATNSYHHGIWAHIEIKDTPIGLNALYTHGPWFFYMSIYANILLIASITLLFFGVFRFPQYYSGQFRLLIIFSVFPWAAHLIYTFSPQMIPLDFTYIVLTIALLLLIAALNHYGFLEITPVARDKFFQNMRDGMLVIDRLGKIVDINRKAEEMLSVTSGSIVGLEYQTALQQYPLLAGYLSQQSENPVELENGGRYFRVTRERLTDKKQGNIGCLIMMYNITEEKLAEAELRNKQKELTELLKTKDKFFSIIAHDLKNPFQGILGYSELLRDYYDSTSESEKRMFISNLYDLSRNTGKMLDNLLQWSRIQMGKMDIRISEFCVNKLTEELAGSYIPTAELKKISISMDLNDVPAVYADRDMIATVIRNLLNNAVKFTRAGGRIKITSCKKNGYVEIAVSDNGVGISEDTQSGLFSIDKSTSTRGTSGEEGTGLGLILCREFIEKNNGTIHVESQTDRGSTFFVLIPAAKQI